MNQLTLYHCNDKERCNQFLKHEMDLIESKEDGIWLGNGMYFWENLANAKYWRDQKEKKSRRLQYLIIKCLVCIDCCLDLTNQDVIDEVYEIWKEACQYVFGCSFSLNHEFGFILNRLFSDEFGCDFSSKYDIVKVLGQYGKEHPMFENNKEKNKNNLSKIRPTSAVKVIYSVKRKSCILSREVIKNG